MFNTSTFFGIDGILTLSDADPTAFDADSFTKYFGEDGILGRVTNVSLNVSTEIKSFHEMGSHAPKEIRAGNITIAGTVERAYINGALLKLMLGKYAEDTETTAFKIPTFNMKMALDNLKLDGDQGNSVLTVYGVIFNNWQFRLPEDDFVLEQLSFRARRISVVDTEIAS